MQSAGSSEVCKQIISNKVCRKTQIRFIAWRWRSPSVHVLQPENDFRRVELHVRLVEDAVLRQVIMQVAAVHEVEDEAELAGRVESVSHAHDERAVLAGRHKAQHRSLVQRKRFALLHLDALLVETLHGVHLACVDLSTAVNFTEASAPDDAKHAEVVHRKLLKKAKSLRSSFD